MKKMLLLVAITLLFSLKLEACANAHIFKIFPLGMCSDTILTVDFHIYRGMDVEMLFDGLNGEIPERKWSLTAADNGIMESSFNMYSYICKYDKNQTLLEKIPVDSMTLSKDTYLNELQLMYTRAFDKAKKDNSAFTLLTPLGIEFGKFDYKCKKVCVKGDIVTYKGVEYPMPILKDSTYYGFNIDYYCSDRLPPIGSARHYLVDNKELVVIHFQMGQEFVKQAKPKVVFNNLPTALYEEPIIYHGNGFDLFIVNETKKTNRATNKIAKKR